MKITYVHFDFCISFPFLVQFFLCFLVMFIYIQHRMYSYYDDTLLIMLPLLQMCVCVCRSFAFLELLQDLPVPLFFVELIIKFSMKLSVLYTMLSVSSPKQPELTLVLYMVVDAQSVSWHES